MSRVLVYQATGVQGAATANRVRQAGYTTRVLIRDESRAGSFVSDGFEVAFADLTDREALTLAHEHVDYVVLQIPVRSDAFVKTAVENAVFAMQSARVKAVIVKMANPTPAQFVPDSGFSANIVVSECLRGASIPFSVVEPTMYLDTLLKPSLRCEIAQEHVIDLPVAACLKVAWTTVDDAARMAVQLLDSRSYGLTVRCAGDIACNGDELAAAYSSALGHEIRYRSTPVDVFQRELESAVGSVAAAPVVAKFRFLSRFPEQASQMLSAPFQALAALPGFRPTHIRDWIEANSASYSNDTR